MSTKEILAHLSDGDAFDFIGRSKPSVARELPVAPRPTAAPESEPRKLRQITARLDEDVHRRLKLYLAQTGEEQQELIARLLEEHFDRNGLV